VNLRHHRQRWARGGSPPVGKGWNTPIQLGVLGPKTAEIGGLQHFCSTFTAVLKREFGPVGRPTAAYSRNCSFWSLLRDFDVVGGGGKGRTFIFLRCERKVL